MFTMVATDFLKPNSRLLTSLHNCVEQLKQKIVTLLIPSFRYICKNVKQFTSSIEGSWSPFLVKFGRPTYETHRHLVNKGEITFGISKEEYSTRRSKLMEKLSVYAQSHIVLLTGMPKRYMIDKIPYLFRQDTDFLYFSGCLEPDCILLLHTLPGSSTYRTVIFVPSYDPSQELWEGPRTDPNAVNHVWGIDEGLPSTQLNQYLNSLLSDLSSPVIWYAENAHNNIICSQMKSWISYNCDIRIDSPKPYIHALRNIKSPAEIKLMKKACSISAEAIAATMKKCCAPVSEHNLFATVDYESRIRGADHLAYPPVVAGGNRANIIHYIHNSQLIEHGELVLMDAGSEFKGYSGDVTRTWPVGGEFSPAQRDLYEAVLYVHQSVITACSEHPSLDQLFQIMCTQLGKVLQELCILPSDYNDSQLARAAYGFCPHHVSHFLGMDVHDTALVSKHAPVESGAVITVEPGIYINEKNTSVPSRYLGLGVRIEDDILIRDCGCEVLSAACPTHPDDIEKLVGSDV